MSPAPLRMPGPVRARTKCISDGARRDAHTAGLERTCVHSGADTLAHMPPLSHSLRLGRPRVSSFALSHSPCEEGPNFSLISFIKRCGEKKRKEEEKGGEGREKGRLGGSNRCAMNGALHGGLHHSAPSRGEYGPRLHDTARC